MISGTYLHHTAYIRRVTHPRRKSICIYYLTYTLYGPWSKLRIKLYIIIIHVCRIRYGCVLQNITTDEIIITVIIILLLYHYTYTETIVVVRLIKFKTKKARLSTRHAVHTVAYYVHNAILQCNLVWCSYDDIVQAICILVILYNYEYNNLYLHLTLLYTGCIIIWVL